MPNPPDDWIRTALKVTGHFEDSSDPLGAVTGDFDGMGISLGVLQWNIGSNSLQAMVNAVGRETVVGLMPKFGPELWAACNCNVKQGLAICRGWQHGGLFVPDVHKELKAFTRSDAFVEQQIRRAQRVATEAYSAAQVYAAADPAYDAVTKALFAWFFDLFTQNGGLKGLGYGDVQQFIGPNGAALVDDVICNWLAARPKGSVGFRDSNANANLWRNSVAGGCLSLFVLSYLRSQLSRPEYRADVMNRKGTIAVQTGWVHSEKHALRELLEN